jgi:hypothetical protein
MRVIAGALVMLAACTPAELGQDDGFRVRLADGCRSEARCESLRPEAQRRVNECMPNSIGYVRCTDARSDLFDVDRRLDAFARRRQAESLVLSRAAQIEEEHQRLQAIKTLARQKWIDQAVQQCRLNASGAACREVPEGIDAMASSDCFTKCREVLLESREHAYLRAESDCVSRIVESRGTAPPDCHFQTPEPDPALEDRRVECAAECRDRAAELLALQHKGPGPARPPRADDEGAPATSPPSR